MLLHVFIILKYLKKYFISFCKKLFYLYVALSFKSLKIMWLSVCWISFSEEIIFDDLLNVILKGLPLSEITLFYFSVFHFSFSDFENRFYVEINFAVRRKFFLKFEKCIPKNLHQKKKKPFDNSFMNFGPLKTSFIFELICNRW
jgi:hypothetical protein